MMTREKKIGQALLYLALVILIGLIIDNNYIKLGLNVLVIIVVITRGVILISGDKEQK